MFAYWTRKHWWDVLFYKIWSLNRELKVYTYIYILRENRRYNRKLEGRNWIPQLLVDPQDDKSLCLRKLPYDLLDANKTPLLLDTATTVIREEKMRVYFYQSRPGLHIFLNLEICTKKNSFLLNWLLNECCKTTQAWIINNLSFRPTGTQSKVQIWIEVNADR